MSETMTGAELQTLREACGMSRDDLAGRAGVQARTVKHWEHGRSGVPADVAELVRKVDAIVSSASAQALQALDNATRHADAAPADLVLLRYASAEDLARYRPDMAGQAPGVHGAIVARVRLGAMLSPWLRACAVRIVWMRADEYEAWRAARSLPDGEITRAQWAAAEVDNQASAHRGDQPPARTSRADSGGMP